MSGTTFETLDVQVARAAVREHDERLRRTMHDERHAAHGPRRFRLRRSR